MKGLKPLSHVLRITPYEPGESTIIGKREVIRLASNENPMGPSPKARIALEQTYDVHRYPDGACTILRETLARHFRLDTERIVCGAGSDELIALISFAFAGPGDEVVFSEHGFPMYQIAAQSVGAKPVPAKEIEFTASVDALRACVTEQTKILFIANPNNPTGTYLPLEEIVRLRASIHQHVLIVIDSAYAEYIDQKDYSAGFELVDKNGRVVVLRTFSKIYGLAGVRLGWAYCPSVIAAALNRIRKPFNVSSIAQVGGIAAVSDKDFVHRSQIHNKHLRAWTTQQLRALGLKVPRSHGNFVLACFPDDDKYSASKAVAFLKECGIITRWVSACNLPNSIRITIGIEEEMRACVQALESFLKNRHNMF